MPIARREMLLQARSPAMFRSRMTMGVITLAGGLAFAILYGSYGASPSMFLGIAAYVLSLLSTFLGAQITADSISREKREGTLGLLFLAGLPAWQIILGKLIANLLTGMMSVFLIFPFFALLMIAGGIMPLEVLGAAAILVNSLFVSGAIGLSQSVESVEQKRAAGRASFIVLALWMGLPLAAQLNSQ